jgi:hypothetical protein
MPDVTVKGRGLCGEIYCFYGRDNEGLCPLHRLGESNWQLAKPPDGDGSGVVG